MSNSKYYLGLSVFCLAIAIYNLNISSEGKSMNCFQTVQMDYDTYLEYNNTIVDDGGTTALRYLQSDSSNNTAVLYDVVIQTSNIYSPLNSIIAILYMLIMALSLFLSLVITYMSNQLPEDFMNVSKWKRFLACFCKIFPLLIIMVHWLLLIIILAVWFMVMTKKCNTSKSTTQVGISEGMYYQNVLVLNMVNTITWIILHYGGALLREILYEEPFMYMPYVGSKNSFAVIMLRKLGP